MPSAGYLARGEVRSDDVVLSKSVSSASTGIVNAMTVDVEDYFQVSAFEHHVARHKWSDFESRVCRNTERLLEIFAEAGVTSTFFVLGWVAERFPTLVRRIAEAGHEIASHGYEHRLIYQTRPAEFREDLRRARAAIEAASGSPVLGYRAPSYSITTRSLWALDVLIEEGYLYDASIFPIRHDRYGIPSAPRHPYVITRPSGTLWELPGATVRWTGQNLPIGGGGYFRLLPYGWTARGIASVNRREGKPITFYLHPWEIDPDQPRLAAPFVSRFRHYYNLSETESRLRRLLSEFRFGPASSLLSSASVTKMAAGPASIFAFGHLTTPDTSC
jgi:polysaccharide deacetylase family protein (PEP-CTERM system associated)